MAGEFFIFEKYEKLTCIMKGYYYYYFFVQGVSYIFTLYQNKKYCKSKSVNKSDRTKKSQGHYTMRRWPVHPMGYLF
jgi:hypothetical protein